MGMVIPQPPLRINSGYFFVPATGTWRVSYSLYSQYAANQRNKVDLYHNGQEVGVMEYFAAYFQQHVGLIETGGREAFFTAKKLDTFHLNATLIQGDNNLQEIMI